jgi:hypothetical protein
VVFYSYVRLIKGKNQCFWALPSSKINMAGWEISSLNGHLNRKIIYEWENDPN